jgi:regulator of sirC expression with transglutaminase-like and TPR domain
LVKHIQDGDEIIIDPFNRGEIKSREDLSKMLSDFYGGQVALSAELLLAASKKQILKRILTNLKVLYIKHDELVKGLSVLDRLVILDPASAADIRDRGAIYLRLECFSQAREDFERYLRLAPNAEDAVEVREQIVSLAKEVPRVH